jgi:hypothetical protein
MVCCGVSDMRACLIIAALFLTAGCSQEPIRVGALPVPDRFLTCQDEPPVPAKPSDAEREGVIARYIVALRAAGSDCRTQLLRVRTYVSETAE